MLKGIGIVCLTLCGVWCYNHPAAVKTAYHKLVGASTEGAKTAAKEFQARK